MGSARPLTGILIWLFVAMLALAAIWLVTKPVAPIAADDQRLLRKGDPARGQLLFAAGDCASCHATPGQDDRLRLGGGLALASAFGTFRAPNISPDPTDGVGSWSNADFANAMLGGVSPHAKHYYPVFPYTSFTGMQLADIGDLWAYLKTLPAVSGRPPPHDLFVLFRARRLLGLWKLLFFREGYWPAHATGDDVLDRGRYLVETVGHCAECHSSRNLLGAIKASTRFAGGADPENTGFVPNITPARIGRWSEADISEMLKSGNTPDHGRVGSTMADVVANTAALPQSDLNAIARYIKSLPPRPTPHP
ncbi:alkylated DNA repair protein [Rhizobium sp. R72]|uniref:cytochrome c n=1 Tax=unclassified Rhizobium TaxID=2613769 RepID=UPI000B529F71|nr:MULTISPECIES: cytochrome c [unclassified Rhizobium]OWV92810.1 alkylated DNA repair protein [Rhizobium sp. R72]OWV93021.1 alkylated DNA repair protein [Rhizobium sp. R711]